MKQLAQWFIPGFMGSPRDIHVLRAFGLDITALRLPHPLSGKETFTTLVDALAKQLTGMPQPVHLLGYSLGGRLAMGLLAECPAAIARLTLIAAHPGLCDQKARMARWRQDSRWIQRFTQAPLHESVEAWLEQPLFAGLKKLPMGQQKQIRVQRLRHKATDLAKLMAVTSLARMPNYRPLLATATIPIQLVVGDQDRKFYTIYQQLIGTLQRGCLSVIPRCHHHVLFEQPKLLAQALGWFAPLYNA